jgi:hypothetical protein
LGDPPGLCREWGCFGGTCDANGFVPNGLDPYSECGGGAPNCNGAGSCGP